MDVIERLKGYNPGIISWTEIEKIEPTWFRKSISYLVLEARWILSPNYINPNGGKDHKEEWRGLIKDLHKVIRWKEENE